MACGRKRQLAAEIPPTALSRATLVTVLYNSGAVVGEMLRGVPEEVAKIAVDNASTDDGIAVARAAGASVVALSANVGFGPGCNHGAAAAETEFVLFVNPDVRIDAATIAALIAAMDADPGLFAVAPMLIEKGAPRQKTRNHLSGAEAADAVACLSGAAFLARRAAFDALGGFDPNIFLYYEEDDLFHRARDAGWRLAALEGVTAAHAHGRSSRPSRRATWLKNYHFIASRLYLEAKYARPRRRWRDGRRGAMKMLLGALTLSSEQMTAGAARLRAAVDAAPAHRPHPSPAAEAKTLPPAPAALTPAAGRGI